MITQTFDLNLIPNSAPVVIHVDQYDHGTGRLIAKLYNGSTAYTPAAGATAIIQGKKPDGHGFMYEATLNGNTVTADLTNQMSVVAGRVFVQFVITESDNRTGTFVFFLDVQPSALPTDTEMSTSEYQVIEELLETAQAINENFPYIGANGHWFYYDVEQGQYVDSGVSAGTSITIGTTTTLDAGDDATVTNSGDNVNAIFNFGIPRGPKGDQGTPGATGPQGPQGPQGEQGEKGDTGNTGATPNITMSATVDGTSSATPTVNVSKTGTAENPDFALAFSGLKGNQGEQGPQGETGATGATGNGIVSITKTGTVGLVDTYTILFTNGQTTTFTVTNGQDGTGSGDMTKAVYDNTNVVANAGGIVNYIDGLNFDKYLAVYGQTAISGADLDQIITLGSYRKTGTGLKSGSPSDIVSADEYVLIVVGAMADKEFDTESIDPAAQLMIAHIAATNETKVYARGFAGFTGIGVLTPHWTTWKSLDSPDVSGKADKVSEATNGDFAGLDSNGNLTDSGYKASDFATPSDIPDITGKADKVSGATSGDFAGLDANGNLTDSGYKPSNITSKADITAIATEENGATASKVYKVGEHFYKDGKFCTAIAYIGSGSTLTLNTNYIADTIGNSLYKNSMMNDFYGAMACVLLPNQANTYITINNSKYQAHLMVISGHAGAYVFMGLLCRNWDDNLLKKLLGGTDLIASGHVICENTGDRGLTLKFPNFTGGCQVWILSMSGTTLGGITTGIYT